MAWLAVDKDEAEYIYSVEPVRTTESYWWKQNDLSGDIGDAVELPKGSIKKLIGRDLTWEDEPVEFV